MADVTITPLANGPFMVSGPIRLQDTQGNQVTVAQETVWLCRCGASSKKPFCDGTHKTNGFTDPATV